MRLEGFTIRDSLDSFVNSGLIRNMHSASIFWFLAGVLVRGLAGIVGLFGLGARALHVGNANAYAYWFLLGAAVLWAFATGVLAFS